MPKQYELFPESAVIITHKRPARVGEPQLEYDTVFINELWERVNSISDINDASVSDFIYRIPGYDIKIKNSDPKDNEEAGITVRTRTITIKRTEKIEPYNVDDRDGFVESIADLLNKKGVGIEIDSAPHNKVKGKKAEKQPSEV